jgi:hypothetical protein
MKIRIRHLIANYDKLTAMMDLTQTWTANLKPEEINTHNYGLHPVAVQTAHLDNCHSCRGKFVRHSIIIWELGVRVCYLCMQDWNKYECIWPIE